MTPSPSVPGTPSLGHAINLPGPSGLNPSGRVSRQSDAASDLLSMGTTLMNSGTDNILDRCVPVLWITTIDMNILEGP